MEAALQQIHNLLSHIVETMREGTTCVCVELLKIPQRRL